MPIGEPKHYYMNMTENPEYEDLEYSPTNEKKEDKFRSHLKETLVKFGKEYGFEPDEEALRETPRRLHQMYGELLRGYKEDPSVILGKVFHEITEESVSIRHIDFVSLCNHHWMPFKGFVHFSYVPRDNQVIGLSKIPRLVQCYARRFQTQEKMTRQIVEAFMKHVNPLGCMAISEAEHLCYQIRGPRSKGVAIVSAVRGCYAENNDLKHEFMRTIK